MESVPGTLHQALQKCIYTPQECYLPGKSNLYIVGEHFKSLAYLSATITKFLKCWWKMIRYTLLALSHLALFCFLLLSRARVHFYCVSIIIWHSLIVCGVVLVLCASSFVQQSLFSWDRACCFIWCMSLDPSLRARRISLIKPSLGHIRHFYNSVKTLTFL